MDNKDPVLSWKTMKNRLKWSVSLFPLFFHLYLLQQQMRPHTMVAMATTIMNDAIVTYNTLHSEREIQITELDKYWICDRYPLSMCCLPQLLSPSPSSVLMKFSIQKGWHTQRRVKESHSPWLEQFSWQTAYINHTHNKPLTIMPYKCESSGACNKVLLLLTDCVHTPSLENEEVIFLLVQFVTESCGNTVTR